MNITGFGQYSKEVAGIKEPKRIMDQQFKLIFIYPILVADKIKVQSSPPFDHLIRDFLSITFLSDLFVQNAFSIIGSANQIRPLWDEKQQTVDPTASILRAMAAQQNINIAGTGTSLPNYSIDAAYSNIVQNKITQKTAVIQKLLKTDPKFAKLRPYIEIITMGNMIEVPVIVGTAYYPVDTLTLMWVLIAAIGLNRPLNSEANINVVFKELENLDEKKYWNLLNNLTQTPQVRKYLGSYFQRLAVAVLSGTEKITRKSDMLRGLNIAAHNKNLKLRQDIDKEPDFKTQQQFAPLYLKKTDLDQTRLFFKFITDPNFARSRYGIDVASEKDKRSEYSRARLQGQLSKLRDLTLAAFNDTVSISGTFWLLSLGNLISINSSNLNIPQIKSNNIDSQLYDNIESNVSEIFIAIDDSIKADDQKYRVEALKDLCNIDNQDVIKNINNWAAHSQVPAGGVFTNAEYFRFVDLFEKANGISQAKIKEIENKLDYIISDDNRTRLRSHLSLIRNEISQAIRNFTNEFINEQKQTDEDFRVVSLNIISHQKFVNQVIPMFRDGMSNILYFLFLAELQKSLCKFILVADVDLETVSTEVTAWPNYTLVLPVEIIMALHAAIMGKSWKHMLSGGQVGQNLNKMSTPMTKEQVSTSGMVNVSDTYVKNIVKFISSRLQVPNLIVVDSKKNEIYYKLMNQSDVNKTKLQTIITFIQSKLDRPLTTQSY